MKHLLKKKKFFSISEASVFLKLLLGFFIFVGIIYFLTLKLLQDSKENVKKEIIDNTAFQLRNYGHALEQDIGQIVNMQSELMVDTDLNRLSSWDEKYLSEFERLSSIRRVLDRLLTIKSSSRYVEDVRVNISLIDKVLSAKEGFDKNKGTSSPDQRMDQYKMFYKDGKLMFIMSKNSLENKEFIFNIVFEIASSEVEKFLDNLAQAGKGEAFLTDKKRTWIFETDNSKISEADKKSIHEYFDTIESNKTEYFSIGRKKYISVSYYVKSLDAHLVVYFPERAFLGKLQMYTEKILIISIFTLLFAITFSLWVYNVIANPLNRLTRAFKKMEKGDMSATISHKRYDEFGYVYDNFNNMADRIKRLIEEVYEQKILAQRAELKQLQYQINPHFLYNSLFQIFMMAKSRDYGNIVVFTNHLSAYYKFITKANAYQVTFEQEVEHASNYINIQIIRFQERIRVEMGEIPEGCGNLMVPRLILQPLIENAFEHGLKDIQKGGYLKVGFWEDREYLVVTVEDNGPNANENSILLLQKYLDEGDEGGFQNSTGIINVHRRLKIRFNGKGGIRVKKNIAEGITVKMYIYKGEGNGI